METKANTALIGAFTLIVLALGFVFIYWLARGTENSANTPLTVIFQDPITGLSVGSQVLFNGIKVGDVRTLTLDPENPRVVVAGLRVQPLRSIKADTAVTLEFQGLTGVGYVQMAGGTPTRPAIWEEMPEPTIRAVRSSMQDLMAGARTILARTDETLQTIEGLVSSNADDISQAVRDVRSFTGALAQNSDGIAGMVDQISAASAGIADATRRLQGIVERGESVITAVDPEQVRTIIADISRMTGSLTAQTERFNAIVERADRIAADAQSFSQHLPALGEKAEALVAAVDPERIGATLDRLDQIAAAVDPAKVASTLDRVDAVTAAVDPEEVRATIASVRATADALKARTDEAAAIVARADAIAQNLEGFSQRLPGLGEKADALVAAVDPEKVGRAVDRIDSVAAAVDPESLRATLESARQTAEALAARSTEIAAIVGRANAISERVQVFSQHLPALGAKADALAVAIDPAKVGNALDRVEAITAAVDPERVRAAVDGAAGLAETFSTHREDIDAIVARLATISQDAAAFTAGLPMLGDRAEALFATIDPAKVGATIDNADRFAAALAANSDDIDAIVADVRSVSERFRALGDRADSLLTKLDSMAGEGAGGILEDVRTTLAAIRTAAQGFNTQVTAIGGGIGNFSDRGLRDVQNLVSEGQRTISRLDRVISDLEKNPSGFIFGGESVPEYGGRRR